MAADQKKRNCVYRENGRRFLSSLWNILVVVMAVAMVWSGEMGVTANTTVTNVTMVVGKSLVVGSCSNNLGNIVGDQAEWYVGCSKTVCHVEPSGNYTVTHGCRALVPSENPDNTNCNILENTAATYPDCCPYLQCGSASGVSTLSPTACVDLSPPSACGIWKLLTSNCSDSTARTYNFTQYCRATCGICTPISG